MRLVPYSRTLMGENISELMISYNLDYLKENTLANCLQMKIIMDMENSVSLRKKTLANNI